MGTRSASPWHWHGFVSGGRGRESGRAFPFNTRTSSTWTRPAKLRVLIQCKQPTATGRGRGRGRGRDRDTDSDSDRILVEECIHKLSYATGVYRSNVNQKFTVTGKQCLFGMEGNWTLSWCMDGRFYEKYDGQEVTFEWGFDGIHNPWYADFAGRTTALELDDMEIAQLAVFVRTGFWLTNKGQDHLDIQIEGEDSFEALRQQIGELVLAIHLRDKRIVARVTIDACHWLPLSMEFNVLGQADRWEYGDWNSGSLVFNHKFPHSCVHYPAGGGRHSYTVKYLTLNSGGDNTAKDKVDTDYLYAFPKTSVVPRYNKYYPQESLDISCPAAVKMIRARSGHLLVRPLIDGKDIGYFILDTGASGLGICPKQAKQLYMKAFGEVYITGFDGQVKSCFLRGKIFQLGPLTIKSPLFVEVDIDNLIVGVESVVGVCGFDVFYNSIVEISCKEGKIFLFDHSHYEDRCNEPLKWERIFFLQNVPNIFVNINGKHLILLLDTGAGGIDVIFHSKAEKYGNLQTEVLANIKGINSTGERHMVNSVLIDKLEIAGHCFKQVYAVYLSASSTQLHLSEYTSGILCMELLTRFNIVFDYRKNRVALIDKKHCDV